jgi:eukaryotic-like serine/threonine-protein kinase
LTVGPTCSRSARCCSRCSPAVAFEGEDDASVISAVLKEDPPPVVALRPDAPAAVDRLVAACLAKDPDARWHCASDLVRELDWIAAAGPGVARQTSPRLHVRPAAAGFVAGIALASAALFLLFTQPETARNATVSFEVAPPPHGTFVPTSGPPGVPQLAVAPDGRRIAAVIALGDGREVVGVRDLGRGTMMAVRGTEGAQLPFWSPDSRSPGFFAGGQLKVVRTLESSPEVLCAAEGPHGGTWGQAGILFSAIQEGDRVGLYLVPAAEGAPKPIARPSSELMRLMWPAFLPGERRYLFTQVEVGLVGSGDVLIGSLDGEEPRTASNTSAERAGAAIHPR